MQNTPANPYQNLTVVRDANMFIGRIDSLRRLYSAMVKQQCISLVGSRHIGKSSLLTCMLLPEIQEQFGHDLRHHIFVPLDLRKYRKTTSEFFFDSVSKQIQAQCQEHQDITLGSRKGIDAFSFALKQVTNKGYKLVLIMDAFDHIAHNNLLDIDFFSYLRAEAQLTGVSYITASINSLYDICRRDVLASPFFNIFDLLNIGPLAQSEAQELITKPSQRVGCPFTEAEQQWILSLAGRHPFFIQRICHILIEEKCQIEISPLDLQRVEELACAELRPHFITLLEALPAHEQKQLEDQIRRDDIQPRIHPELSESLLFKKFLREKYAISLSKVITQITVKDFEKVLNQIDDLFLLGESPLKHLKVVSTRLESHTPSPIEVGRAIRMLLLETLNRLKGSSIRKDSAADWRLYNILYYRYFKRQSYKWNNEQLAANLECTSLRQFYRDREKAIKSLLQEVFDLEKSAY